MREFGVVLLRCSLSYLSASQVGQLKEYDMKQGQKYDTEYFVIYTPKHGSWLNMAEIELSALDCQCLSQRLASFEQAEQQVAAWTTRRDQRQTTIQWRFTAKDASIKLKHLLPVNQKLTEH